MEPACRCNVRGPPSAIEVSQRTAVRFSYFIVCSEGREGVGQCLCTSDAKLLCGTGTKLGKKKKAKGDNCKRPVTRLCENSYMKE